MTEPPWHQYLKPQDWLVDGGSAVTNMSAWDGLDWSKASMDMGPSPAGNPGPYWHVPSKDGDCSHRLYPKLPNSLRRVLREIADAAARYALATAESGK